MKHIQSPDNPQLKHWLRLAGTARYRKQRGRVLLEGDHLIRAALDRGVLPVAIVLREGFPRSAEVTAILARTATVPTVLLGDSLFCRLADTHSPTGILAEVLIPGGGEWQGGSALLLEAVQDPGNVGTLLRTAAAAGVRHVYLSPGCCDPWSPKVLRAAMGAHFFLQLHPEADLVTVAQAFPGPVVATDLAAQTSLFALDLVPDAAFIFGHEGQGISAGLLACAGRRVRIPMPGKMESLNVAAAAAVCLFEQVRQRTLS